MIFVESRIPIGLSGIELFIEADKTKWPKATGKPYLAESSDLGVFLEKKNVEDVKFVERGSFHTIANKVSLTLSFEEAKRLVVQLNAAIKEEEKFNSDLQAYMESHK